MEDYLKSPDERISSFGNILKAATEENNEQLDSSPYKEELLSESYVKDVNDKISGKLSGLSVKFSVDIELLVRKELFEHYQKTGEKITIQRFITKAIQFYIENNS